MQITVEISDQFATEAAELGLTPEVYASELLSDGRSNDALWEAEALRRANGIDTGQTTLVAWEQIESRLRARIAG